MLKRVLLVLTLLLVPTVRADEPECVGDCQIAETGVYIEGKKVVGAQQPAITDADATLQNTTEKLNQLLDAVRRHGLIAGTATPTPETQTVSVYAPAAQTIPNGAWTPVFFTGEFDDAGNIHSNTNPSLVTITKAAKYDAHMTICFAANDTGARSARIVLTVGRGVLEFQGQQVRAVGDNKLTCVSADMPILRLPVGAKIEGFAYHDAAKRDTVDLYPGRSSFSVGER